MTRAAFEKEMRQRVSFGRGGEVERIAETRAQVVFDGRGLVVGGGRLCRDLPRQRRDAWIQIRQLQIELTDRTRVVGRSSPQPLRRHRWQIRESLITQLGEIVIGVGQRISSVHHQIGAPGCEPAAHAIGLSRDEQGIGGQWFEQHGVAKRDGALTELLRRLGEQEPAVSGQRDDRAFVRWSEPTPAVEVGQRDAAPAHAADPLGPVLGAHTHHHRGVLLDRADLAELDVVAKARNQRGMQGVAAEIPDAETRDQEKDHRASQQRAHGSRCRRQAKRAVQTPCRRRSGFEWRYAGPFGAAPHLQADKRRNRQDQEDQKGDQEEGVHGEDGRSQHVGEGEHGQK